MICIGDKILPWARIRSWVRQSSGRIRIGNPVDVLSRIEGVPGRIDVVARDINSGAFVFADIDPWELGELLGLDWEDAPAEWCYTTLRARMSLHDAGYSLPYTENLQLLEGLVSDERYAELHGLADDPPPGLEAVDLPLTDKEAGLLEAKYAETKATDAWSIGLARTELVASDGTMLRFEVESGDTGDLENPKGPYEFESGEFLDLTDWIEID